MRPTLPDVKTDLACFPCFLRQCLIALEPSGADTPLKEAILQEVAVMLGATSLDQPPAAAASGLHRHVRQRLGGDPFAHRKKESNATAARLLPRLDLMARNSGDAFELGVRAALAGNMMDFGLFTDIDLEKELNSALSRPVEGDGIAALRAQLENAEHVVYLFDNAGEIVFDGFLIRMLMDRGHRVTGVVKGGPVINDATAADAAEAGLPGCSLVDNGSDAVGTVLDTVSEECRLLLAGADLVVSKGQANFETLFGAPELHGGNIAFLFQAKCDVVAGTLGRPKGAQWVLCGNGVRD